MVLVKNDNIKWYKGRVNIINLDFSCNVGGGTHCCLCKHFACIDNITVNNFNFKFSLELSEPIFFSICLYELDIVDLCSFQGAL
jgi:hypothetical protein